MAVDTAPDDALEACVARVRRFNRFYTQAAGILRDGLLGGPLSLTEVRVLYEIAQRGQPTAAELGKELGLDRGYLSRTVGALVKGGLVARTPSAADARALLLALTPRGRKMIDTLDKRSSEEVRDLLKDVPPGRRGDLVRAMEQVERILTARAASPRTIVLRTHRAGDLGWIVERHGALYAAEYGWGEQFEALVAGVVAEFGREHDPTRERCWIAEVDDERAGSILLARQSDTVAKLRLLLVEPDARGLGLGRRLVDECVRFARAADYRKVVLWTNRGLDAARGIYEKAGFRLVEEKPHQQFGQGLVGQTWELTLAAPRPLNTQRA